MDCLSRNFGPPLSRARARLVVCLHESREIRYNIIVICDIFSILSSQAVLADRPFYTEKYNCVCNSQNCIFLEERGRKLTKDDEAGRRKL